MTTTRALGAWVALVAVMAASKGFALATSAWRFGRTLAPADVACGAGGDALVALALLALALLLRAIGPRVVARAASTLLTALLVLLTALYLLSGYVFWEWGWYLEPPHLDAGRMAGVSADLFEFVLDRKMALVALLFGAALLGAWSATRRLRSAATRRRAIGVLAATCVALAIGAFAPLAHPGAFDPAVPSPLLLLANDLRAGERGLDWRRWPPSDSTPLITSALREPALPIPTEWGALAGAARGLDLVIVVLESTRRDRVSLYGAARDTTPRLARLADHALVFEEAWATQPRSCKTMESLLLGIDPDPQSASLTWGELAPATDSLLRRRAQNGDALYFGTSFAKETDAFDAFVASAAGRPLDRCVGAAELGAAVRPTRQSYDDRALVADFLRWRATEESTLPAGVRRHATALLWFAAAHHPYRAVETPFGEATLAARYDNSVWCADRALGELIDGLDAEGRFDDTLLLIVGDHGEALGERGDRFHGSFLWDHSLRVPCLLVNRRMFPEARRCDVRFGLRDLAGTLLWLFGDERPLRESRALFANRRDESLLLSNVYQDLKLGLLVGDRKVTFRPERDELWVHDRAVDPAEQHDLSATLSEADRAALRQSIIDRYWEQRARAGTIRALSRP